MKKYFHRHIESRILRMNQKFKVLLVTGARQVGKSTLLSHCGSDRTKVSLDTVVMRGFANESPDLFLSRYKSPVIIDEIQKAPELFAHIKEIVDASEDCGSYWLTGSHQMAIKDGAQESLAGRAGVLHLLGISTRELYGGKDVEPFLPTAAFVTQRRSTKEKTFDADDVFYRIWKGSYPRLCLDDDVTPADWSDFYSSYVDTYITRDVSPLKLDADEYSFIKFMKTLAIRIGQELNLSDVANDVGITPPTAKSWLSILSASGLIYQVPPYFTNKGKQIRRASKLYFTDTGLAAWFAGWPNAEVLREGMMRGAFFENYVVMEILKSWRNVGIEPQLYFYRDSSQREIDLLIGWQNKLHPIEIKVTGIPNAGMVKNFDVISADERGSGALVCTAADDRPLTANDFVIPVGYL